MAYTETADGLIKKVAKNHQYLGVNNSIEALYREKWQQARAAYYDYATLALQFVDKRW